MNRNMKENLLARLYKKSDEVPRRIFMRTAPHKLKVKLEEDIAETPFYNLMKSFSNILDNFCR